MLVALIQRRQEVAFIKHCEVIVDILQPGWETIKKSAVGECDDAVDGVTAGAAVDV